MIDTSADESVHSKAESRELESCQMTSDESRICPMCGAVIKAVAHKCRYCGEMLTPTIQTIPSAETLKGGRFEPRSFLALFVILFPVMAIFFALFWSWGFAALQNRPFAEILPFGIAAGFFFGLFCGAMFAFTMRRDTQTVAISDRADFLGRLDKAITKIHYTSATTSGNFLMFKPRFGAGVGAGIRIELRDGQAVIIGPKASLSKLLKQIAANDDDWQRKSIEGRVKE